MKTKYNKSAIMKEAHRLLKYNRSMGWCWALKTSWSNAKQRVANAVVEAKNEAIRAIWKAEADAKRTKGIETHRKRVEASGMDLHTYTMTSYYNGNGYKGD